MNDWELRKMRIEPKKRLTSSVEVTDMVSLLSTSDWPRSWAWSPRHPDAAPRLHGSRPTQVVMFC
jgi:hypothetical protein